MDLGFSPEVAAQLVDGTFLGAAELLVASGKDPAALRAQVTSRDEIGALATTFNSMTGRLIEMITMLESRVAERTGQLQAAADIGRATASVRRMDALLRLAPG